MSTHETGDQSHNPGSPLEGLDVHIQNETAHLHEARSFLENCLADLENLPAVNERLSFLARDDLVITERAEVLPITDVRDVHNLAVANNFASYFKVYVGFTRSEIGITGISDMVPVPIDEEGLDDLANGITEFPEDHVTVNHAQKPAFIRMLALYPELTKKIVLTMSSSELNSRIHQEQLTLELFAAYQIMSRLIDSSDKDVKNKDGTINSHYLCH